MSAKLLLFTLLATAMQAIQFEILETRDPCNPCNPSGATGTKSPTVGSDLKTLYIDLLASVRDIHFRRRRPDNFISARADGFCCRESLDCVNIRNLNIPMCYDKFTTNYQFPDGSYGSLTTGDFVSQGSKANLLSGQYSKEGGEIGNMYADDVSAKPNTSTLSIPPQFTGTGVGGAIPASEIGSVVVVTSMVGGTTITAPTTISAATRSGTTVPAQTITGPTTITPSASLMTSTATSQRGPASSSSSRAAAARDKSRSGSFGLAILSAFLQVVGLYL
ncbi:hypothetical protein CC80DRAFT_540388 [Byssothecium circinans]|uniref:Uncharacterized protein n=1 Tax=Byssothecium circinans TaxID=147558 RepID=A0A6A5TAJ6_9PLEO|nr:hypothetical protein CC80DRAFT_540388 [Byssothecium circinans]